MMCHKSEILSSSWDGTRFHNHSHLLGQAIVVASCSSPSGWKSTCDSGEKVQINSVSNVVVV